MANLVDWIVKEAGEEPVEAVVIGAGPNDRYSTPAQPWQYVVLSFEEAVPHIDYKFDSGYGGVGCHAVYAYTPTRVIAISQYDGSTGTFSIPRNPTAGDVDMPGG